MAWARTPGLCQEDDTIRILRTLLLDPIDHFIKEDLRVPGYLRYADYLLLGGDKRQLWAWRERLVAMRMRLHVGKTQVRATSSELKFLGLVVSRDGRRLQYCRLQPGSILASVRPVSPPIARVIPASAKLHALIKSAARSIWTGPPLSTRLSSEFDSEEDAL
jgi:hypothetical protein